MTVDPFEIHAYLTGVFWAFGPYFIEDKISAFCFSSCSYLLLRAPILFELSLIFASAVRNSSSSFLLALLPLFYPFVSLFTAFASLECPLFSFIPAEGPVSALGTGGLGVSSAVGHSEEWGGLTG